MPAPLDVTPIVLAGGVGRRLWPLSRETHPKPYLKCWGRTSFLQRTLARLPNLQPPVIVASQKNLSLLQRQLQFAAPAPAQIFLEPVGRNTAAAAAFAAHYFVGSGQDPLLLIMPSDHFIKQPDLLRDAVMRGSDLARRGQLVLFGIKPRRAVTGFGYIRPGQAVGENFHAVEEFVEKPEAPRAAHFIQSGWLWNSGIFLFSASAYLNILQQTAPAVYDASLAAVRRAQRRQALVLLDEKSLADCPSLSIDRAVMEKAGMKVVTALDMGWNDLGTWPALLRNFIGI